MADAKRCDRCREYYEEGIFNHKVTITTNPEWSNRKKRDLCPKCEKELLDWLGENNEDIPKIDISIVKLQSAGYSSHDCEAWYKCPKCGKDWGSWSFFHMDKKQLPMHNGKFVLTCSCKQRFYMPD